MGMKKDIIKALEETKNNEIFLPIKSNMALEKNIKKMQKNLDKLGIKHNYFDGFEQGIIIRL